MEEQNIDKAIREKLNGFLQQPPSHIWDNIQGRLVAQKRRRKIVFISRIAVAAMVVLAFVAGWYFNEKSEQVSPAVSESRIQDSKDSDELVAPGTVSESVSQPNQGVVTKESQNTTESQISGYSKMENITPESDLAEATPLLSDNDEKSQVSLTSEIIGFSGRQDTELDLLDKVDAFFNRKEKENIQIKQITIPVNEMSKADEILIAENIRNLDNQVEDRMRWKVGVQVSPGYSSQNSSYSEVYSNAMTYSGQSGNANISGGISVQMKAGKNWSIESGVYYAQNGQHSTNSGGFNFQSENYYGSLDGGFFNTEVNLVNGQIAMNSTAGVIEFSKTPQGAELSANLDEFSASNSAPALVTEGEFSQVFEFVEVPFYLRYTLIDANFGVEIMGGLNAGIVTGNKVYMKNQYGNQNIGKTRDISTMNFSGTLGLGVNYGLGKNISLAVEPRLSYYINSINQNPDVSFRPYRIGVYTGLYYEF